VSKPVDHFTIGRHLDYGLFNITGPSGAGASSAMLVDDVRITISTTPVSTEMAKELEFVMIYPNPTAGIVNFNKLREEIRVFDVDGKKVAQKVRSSSVDLSGLPSGIYFIEADVERFKVALIP